MVNNIFQFAQIDKNHYYIVRLNKNLNLHTQDGLHIFSSNGSCPEVNDEMLGFDLPEEDWFDDALEDEFHYNYFNELNAARGYCGVNPLMWNDELEAFAQFRAKQILTHFSRRLPNGSPAICQHPLADGEIIVRGKEQIKAESLVDALNNSAIDGFHQLNEQYRIVGASHCFGTDGQWYFACVFGFGSI